MEQLFDQKIPATSCDALLTKSYRIYQEILDQYESLRKAISRATPSQIQQQMEQLHRLVDDVRTIDAMATETLKVLPEIPAKTLQLMQTRQALIAMVHERNRKLKKSAENIRSHLRHELDSMTKNRTALQGYKPATPTKRPRINATF